MNLDRADLELFRRLARRLLLERNLARMSLILRLLDVQIICRCRLSQSARHEEIAAVALADLDQVALLTLALNIGLENNFHDGINSFSDFLYLIEAGQFNALPVYRFADRQNSRRSPR